MVFDGFRRFSTVFDGFRRFSTVFDCFRRFSTVFDGFRRFSTVFDGFCWFSIVFDSFQLFSIVFNGLSLHAVKTQGEMWSVIGEVFFLFSFFFCIPKTNYWFAWGYLGFASLPQQCEGHASRIMWGMSQTMVWGASWNLGQG